jgi:hypothetical protein
MLLATTDHMAVATFPRPINIHVVVKAARALIGVAMRCLLRWPAATLDLAVAARLQAGTEGMAMCGSAHIDGGKLHHAVTVDRSAEVTDTDMTLRQVPIDLASRSAIV